MEPQESEPIPQTSGRRKLAFAESTPAEKIKKPESDRPQDGPSKKEKNGKKTYDQMVLDAITDNDPKRKGLSFVMIQKFIKGKYMMEGEIKFYVKKAYEKLKEKKMIEHVTGNGFSGSIRLSKEHIENMRKTEKLAAKAQKEKKKAPARKDKKTDKNNNKKEAKPKGKPKDAAKVNPKKTAITKTKIDRTGGKVRLSITAKPVAQVKGTKTKKGPKGKIVASEGKTDATKKSAKASAPKDSNAKKPTTKKAKET
uniref:Uncharacterized protein n=1 Tax=Anopheles atroparvus TaxID=41427 RepID=A0A182J8A8_ANOAO